MVEQVPAVAYTWDPSNEPGAAPAAYISPQIERLLGYTPDQWLDDPRTWERQVHPDDLEGVLAAWKRAVGSEGRFVSEYRIRRADGAQVWVRDEAVPVTNDGLVHYRGVMYDVTAERETALALESAEERYRSLVEQLPAVTYRSDVHVHLEGDRVGYVSPQVLELAGFTPEEWSSPGMWESRIHPERPRGGDRRSPAHGSDRRAVRRRVPARAEGRHAGVGARHRDGRGARRGHHRVAGRDPRCDGPQGSGGPPARGRGAVPDARGGAAGRDLRRRHRRHRDRALPEPPVSRAHRIHARRAARRSGAVDAHRPPRRP